MLSAANRPEGLDLRFLEPRLAADAAPLATGTAAVCAFVNDQRDAAALASLAGAGGSSPYDRPDSTMPTSKQRGIAA